MRPTPSVAVGAGSGAVTVLLFTLVHSLWTTDMWDMVGQDAVRRRPVRHLSGVEFPRGRARSLHAGVAGLQQYVHGTGRGLVMLLGGVFASGVAMGEGLRTRLLATTAKDPTIEA